MDLLGHRRIHYRLTGLPRHVHERLSYFMTARERLQLSQTNRVLRYIYQPYAWRELSLSSYQSPNHMMSLRLTYETFLAQVQSLYFCLQFVKTICLDTRMKNAFTIIPVMRTFVPYLRALEHFTLYTSATDDNAGVHYFGTIFSIFSTQEAQNVMNFIYRSYLFNITFDFCSTLLILPSVFSQFRLIRESGFMRFIFTRGSRALSMDYLNSDQIMEVLDSRVFSNIRVLGLTCCWKFQVTNRLIHSLCQYGQLRKSIMLLPVVKIDTLWYVPKALFDLDRLFSYRVKWFEFEIYFMGELEQSKQGNFDHRKDLIKMLIQRYGGPVIPNTFSVVLTNVYGVRIFGKSSQAPDFLRVFKFPDIKSLQVYEPSPIYNNWLSYSYVKPRKDYRIHCRLFI